MAASVFGSGTYGTADETSTTLSIYTASITLNVTSEQAYAPDHIGEDVGLAIYNERAELSFEGVLSSADTTGAAVADVLQAVDIANSGIFGTDTSCTVFYATGVTLTRNQSGFETGSVTLVSSAGITATTATTVS